MTEPITDEQLAALDAAHQAATPTPWYAQGGSAPVYIEGGASANVVCAVEDGDLELEWPDATYITMACNLAPALVSEVRRLRAQVAATPGQHEGGQDGR